MSKLDFGGRVAVVTGAGSGLGRAHAQMLASRGCRVVVNDVNRDAAERVARSIADQSGTAIADAHSVVGGAAAMVEAALAVFGRLDIIVNNAGILEEATFAETSAEIWHKVADVHYRGTVEVCRAAWPHLAKSGAGRIVNTASSGMLGNIGLTAYGSAKAATFGLTRSLALEGAAAGITVNCILPSAWTNITAKIDDPAITTLLQEYFQPEHVSALVAWLAHPATAVTGEAFRVSGGSAARIVIGMMPPVKAPQSTPEAWAALEPALLNDGAITPLASTADLFGRELKDACPAALFDMSQERGGLALAPVTKRDG